MIWMDTEDETYKTFFECYNHYEDLTEDDENEDLREYFKFDNIEY